MDISLNGFTYKDARVVKGRYLGGSLALTLEDSSGDLIAVVSVLVGAAPAEGCIWVKDYSENSGALEGLVAAGVLETTGRVKDLGFVSVQEARVLV